MKVKAKNAAAAAAFQRAECRIHGFGVIYQYYNELTLCRSHTC
jgi:hypothetical protein